MSNTNIRPISEEASDVNTPNHVLVIPDEVTKGKLLSIYKITPEGKTDALAGILTNAPIEVGKKIQCAFGKTSKVSTISIKADGVYVITTQSGSKYEFDPKESLPAPNHLQNLIGNNPKEFYNELKKQYESYLNLCHAFTVQQRQAETNDEITRKALYNSSGLPDKDADDDDYNEMHTNFQQKIYATESQFFHDRIEAERPSIRFFNDQINPFLQAYTEHMKEKEKEKEQGSDEYDVWWSDFVDEYDVWWSDFVIEFNDLIQLVTDLRNIRYTTIDPSIKYHGTSPSPQ